MIDGKDYKVPSTIDNPRFLEDLILQFKEEGIGAFKKDKTKITKSLKALADNYYHVDSLAKYFDVYRINQNDPEGFWETIAENNFVWKILP